MPLQRYVSPELTHFVGRGLRNDEERYVLLVQTILRQGRLGVKGPGQPEGGGFTLTANGDRDPLSNEMYELPMVCFCDIPPDDLDIHMAKYSRFGIGFRKSFLLGKGARPVFYIPKPTEDRRHAFRCLADLNNLGSQLVLSTGPRPDTPPACTDEIRRLISRLNQAMNQVTLDVLTYIKFFDAETAEDDETNFYMEREWRVRGIMDFSLTDVSRIIVPACFAARFRQDVPEYFGQVMFSDS